MNQPNKPKKAPVVKNYSVNDRHKKRPRFVYTRRVLGLKTIQVIQLDTLNMNNGDYTAHMAGYAKHSGNLPRPGRQLQFGKALGTVLFYIVKSPVIVVVVLVEGFYELCNYAKSREN